MSSLNGHGWISSYSYLIWVNCDLIRFNAIYIQFIQIEFNQIHWFVIPNLKVYDLTCNFYFLLFLIFKKINSNALFHSLFTFYYTFLFNNISTPLSNLMLKPLQKPMTQAKPMDGIFYMRIFYPIKYKSSCLRCATSCVTQAHRLPPLTIIY